MTAFHPTAVSIPRGPSRPSRLQRPWRWLAVTAVATLAAAGVHAQLDEPIKPLPLDGKFDARKVTLGDKLFHDKRLSKDNSVACVSCHNLNQGGADNVPLSLGIGGKKGTRSIPPPSSTPATTSASSGTAAPIRSKSRSPGPSTTPSKWAATGPRWSPS